MADTLLHYYQAIEASSRKMLDAILIEQLRLTAHTQELLPAQRSEKTRIMQRILMNDAQIRYLAEPWLEHLEQRHDQPMLH
jgi:flagellar protein FliT